MVIIFQKILKNVFFLLFLKNFNIFDCHDIFLEVIENIFFEVNIFLSVLVNNDVDIVLVVEEEVNNDDVVNNHDEEVNNYDVDDNYHHHHHYNHHDILHDIHLHDDHHHDNHHDVDILHDILHHIVLEVYNQDIFQVSFKINNFQKSFFFFLTDSFGLSVNEKSVLISLPSIDF